MAVFADTRCQNMIRALAGGIGAVVAGAARTQHLGVIDGGHRRERGRVVTILANVGRLHVGRIFARRFGAIVAAEAIGRDVRVIEIDG